MRSNLGRSARNIGGSGMGNSGQVVQRQGFFRNFLNSIIGVFIGILFIFGSCFLLFWNEVRPNPADAARMATELTPANSSALQNQAVWVRGALTGTQVGLDQFLSADLNKEFIALERVIERWVWVEEEHRTERDRLGGGTETIITYEYNLKWSTSTPNSSQFRGQNAPENPAEKPGFTRFSRVANDLTIAGFNLGSNITLRGAYTQFIPTATTIAAGLVFNEGYIYEYDRAITAPAVGDYRISYWYIENNTDGIALGRLNGQQIEQLDFRSTGLIKTSSTIYRFFNAPTINQVISILDSENRTLTLILRIVGYAIMLVGFTMLFGPIQAIARIIPLIKMITGKITFLIAIIFSLVLSLVVIVVANILNSLIALLFVLALVGALIGFGVYRGKKKKETAANSVPIT
ncbi:MAG: TMEM43 family protein [Spirochaetaceae bacterium]|nr:TMEM43 family protein [Spirochaetaceae bacterium]